MSQDKNLLQQTQQPADDDRYNSISWAVNLGDMMSDYLAEHPRPGTVIRRIGAVGLGLAAVPLLAPHAVSAYEFHSNQTEMTAMSHESKAAAHTAKAAGDKAKAARDNQEARGYNHMASDAHDGYIGEIKLAAKNAAGELALGAVIGVTGGLMNKRKLSKSQDTAIDQAVSGIYPESAASKDVPPVMLLDITNGPSDQTIAYSKLPSDIWQITQK